MNMPLSTKTRFSAGIVTRLGLALSIVIGAAIAPVRDLLPPAFSHSKDAGEYSANRSTKTNSGKHSQTHSGTNQALNPWDLLNQALMPPAMAMNGNVQISIEGPFRYVRSNGLPDHATGQFPNPGNPNTISEQDYVFRLPVEGQYTGVTTKLFMSPFGVAINGVPFDPGAAEYWNRNPNSGWQYEAMFLGPRLGLDQNNAHVQPNGAYHYHGLPTGLLQRLGQMNRPILIGYAADGFPIYGSYGYKNANNPSSGMQKLKSSYRVKHGQRTDTGTNTSATTGGGIRNAGPGGAYDGSFVQDYEYVESLGDLDDTNGRRGVTPEYPKGTYYYVVTDTYPYIPRGFKGHPDESFRRRGHAAGSMRGPGGGFPGGTRGAGPQGGGFSGRGPHGDGPPGGDFSGRGPRGDGPPGGGFPGGPRGDGPPDGGFPGATEKY